METKNSSFQYPFGTFQKQRKTEWHSEQSTVDGINFLFFAKCECTSNHLGSGKKYSCITTVATATRECLLEFFKKCAS
jgi:hypothetical protein